jgi:hypothetical protein
MKIHENEKTARWKLSSGSPYTSVGGVLSNGNVSELVSCFEAMALPPASTTNSLAAIDCADTSRPGFLLLARSSPTTVSSASIAAPSLSVAVASLPLGVRALPSTDASMMAAAQLPVSSAELEKAVLTQPGSLKTEADLGGQLGQGSGKKFIASGKYSVLPQSPAPVCAVGTYTVERGGLKYAVLRANQQSPNKKKEAGHTFEELARTSTSPLNILLTSTSLNSPSYSFGSLSRALSDLFFVTASLVIALVSAIVQAGMITHLEHLEVGDAAPYRLWEREGIGTRLGNEFLRRGRAITH